MKSPLKRGITLFKKSKLSILFMSAATSLLLFSGIASAHVSVNPSTSTPGAWETYTIKIPVEKDIPTMKVSLKIPDVVDFKQYQPVPDWKVTTEKDSSGKVSTITWTAINEGISAGEFQMFNFVVQNPKEDASIAWDAYQYYNDGSIVEWTGNEESTTPHSVTLITTATATSEGGAVNNGAHDGHGNSTGTPSVEDKPSHASDHSDSSETSSTLDMVTLILSVLALIISIIALIKALNNRRK